MKIKGIPYTGRLKDIGNTILLIPSRLEDVAKASSKLPKPSEDRFQMNKVAKALHPKCQELIITNVEELSPDFKRYTFKNRDDNLAYFRAGQYLSFPITIGSAVVTRAYSIASSPAQVTGEHYYQIAVKRVPDGFVSGYILDNWKRGMVVQAYAPEGTFVYEPLRDAKHLIGVAGGSGITPFLSLAKALDAGIENMETYTLLYGAKTVEELFFKDELDAIAARNDNFNVVYVLSDEAVDNYEQGFINADLIRKYAPDEDQYSIFACGPKAMYNFLGGEVEKLNLRKKFVRFELQGAAKNMASEPAEYQLTVLNRGETVTCTCSSQETVLVALEKAGVSVPVRCRSGECGYCRSKVVSGQYYLPEGVADYRRIADARFGYIHPCCAYPASDLTLKIN